MPTIWINGVKHTPSSETIRRMQKAGTMPKYTTSPPSTTSTTSASVGGGGKPKVAIVKKKRSSGGGVTSASKAAAVIPPMPRTRPRPGPDKRPVDLKGMGTDTRPVDLKRMGMDTRPARAFNAPAPAAAKQVSVSRVRAPLPGAVGHPNTAKKKRGGRKTGGGF